MIGLPESAMIVEPATIGIAEEEPIAMGLTMINTMAGAFLVTVDALTGKVVEEAEMPTMVGLLAI